MSGDRDEGRDEGREEGADGPREGAPSVRPSALVVFPVRNEAERLPRLLGPLTAVVRREGYHLLAIDDASTDDSAAILARSGVPTLRLPENLGYGAALQTGYKYALSRGYRVLLQLDGDGQHDPRFLPRIREALRDCEVVIGSRFLRADPAPFPPAGPLYRGTPGRRAGIALFRALLRLLLPVRITDPTSGYLGFDRAALRFLSRDDHPYDFPDADVVFRLVRSGLRVREIPVYMYPNEGGGQLHRGLAPLWYLFKVALSLFVSVFGRAGERRP